MTDEERKRRRAALEELVRVTEELGLYEQEYREYEEMKRKPKTEPTTRGLKESEGC